MKTSPRASLALACALPLFVGCVDLEDSDVEVGSTQSELINFDRCDIAGCGLNGPDTDGHGYSELNTKGYPYVNELGYYIERVTSLRGDNLRLSVSRTRLIAVTSRGTKLKGDALVGMTIKLRNVNRPRWYWTLRLVDYAEVSTYLVGDADTIPTYRFASSQNGAPEINLCNNVSDVENELGYHAIVFEGDRYDRQAKTITEDSLTSGWFNIACNRATANKLVRLRYAKVAAKDTYVSNVNQRQAAYKAYVGDFCGTGESLTKKGTRITTRLNPHWGWGDLGCILDSHEAIWDETGPVCLNQYRLANDPALSAAVEACGIPECSGNWGTWRDDGLFLTGNPWIFSPAGACF